VVNLAEVLERDPDRRDREEAASRILRAALRCRLLVQDLLSYSRPQPARPDPLRVEDAIIEAMELDPFSGVGEIQVSLDHSQAIPGVRADRHRLTQVLVNLISNARQATIDAPGSSRAVRIRLAVLNGQESRLDLPAERRVVQVAVEDDGPGIPDDLRDRIFDPFVSTKPAGVGTGLGLSICRELLAAMEGTLYLDGSYPGGARFVVELPAAAAPVVAAESRPPTSAPAAPEGRRVLLIDDDRDVLETYEVILAMEGHHVRSCHRGRDALAALEQDDFDVILCDLRLPDIPGPELLAILEGIRPELASRVIFATGDVMSDSSQAFLAETPNPVLYKPFRIEDLLRAMERVTGGG
jgi:two-component system NtrC family sensor kinase